MEFQNKKIKLIDAIIIASLMTIIGVVIGFKYEDFSYKINQVLPRKTNSKIPNKLSYKALDDLYKRIKSDYDGKVDDRKLIEGASKGMVAALGDRHTVYFTPKEAQEFRKSLEGDVGAGIGAEVNFRDGFVNIVRPIRGNPAYAAGIMPGDIVVKVDNKPMEGKTLEQVVSKMKGKAGTKVKITIVRTGEPKLLEFDIIRETIKNPSVIMEYKKGIPVIEIKRFDQQTNYLVRRNVAKIKKVGHKRVIIDLRGNPGGYLRSAQKVASLWVDGKVIVSEKIDGKTVQEFSADSDDTDLKGFKTVVLVNEGSASASEILAAALQDYNKATLIGEKTYGKGSVQKLKDLSHGGQLKITMAHWYTPNNKTIEKKGVDPDIKVKYTIEDWKARKDPQLEKAIEFLNKK